MEIVSSGSIAGMFLRSRGRSLWKQRASVADSVQRISRPSFLHDLIVFVGQALEHCQHRGLACIT